MQIYKVDVHGMPDAGRQLDEVEMDTPHSGWALKLVWCKPEAKKPSICSEGSRLGWKLLMPRGPVGGCWQHHLSPHQP